MCEFKPGDEVVCVDDSPIDSRPIVIHAGGIYTVGRVRPLGDRFVVYLADAPNPHGDGFWHHRFRKVQRRDLSAWLKTATKFEEPKRKKANA